jgi:hypothetical protein
VAAARITSNSTASIYQNDFGVELRVEHHGQLLESRLSRYGDRCCRSLKKRKRDEWLKDGRKRRIAMSQERTTAYVQPDE